MTYDAATTRTPGATNVVTESDAMLNMIDRAARDPAVDVDKFERLMMMKERLDAQRAERAFNAAIAAAKSEFPQIVKNRTVTAEDGSGGHSYKHEDFAEIASKVDPVMGRHGLSYRFRSSQSGFKLTVTCIVSHSGGRSEETTLESAEDHSGEKNSIQAIGSAATYLQRYTLKLALGLAAATDNDAAQIGAARRVRVTASTASTSAPAQFSDDLPTADDEMPVKQAVEPVAEQVAADPQPTETAVEQVEPEADKQPAPEPDAPNDVMAEILGHITRAPDGTQLTDVLVQYATDITGLDASRRRMVDQLVTKRRRTFKRG